MPAAAVETLVLPRYLVPIAPDNVVHDRWGVALSGDTIADVDTEAALVDRYPDATRIELMDHIVMPGLVNAHGHLSMSLLRGLGESLPLERWLEEVIWPLEGEHVDADFVADGTHLAMAEMLSRGVTTASDMYFHPDVAADAAIEAGFRLQAAFPIFEMTTRYARDAAECIHKGLALVDHVRDVPTVHAAFGPHAAYTVSGDVLDRVLMLSSELSLPIQMHLHETRSEVADARRKVGASWIEHLETRGFLVPELQAVHMTALTPEEVDLVSERAVSVVHCPRSNLKLASGYCPVAELKDRGVNVALGTDGSASNDSLDLLDEARLAGLLGKLDSRDPATLPARELLAMATLDGAKALGLDDRIGSIEPGKSADLIAIDTRAPSLQPLNDIHAQLVHADASHHVTHAWVAGRCLLADGEHTTIDIDRTLAHAGEWRTKLAGG